MSLNVEMKTVLVACATVVCALVAVAPSVAAPAKRPPALTPVAHDALTRALEGGELTEAQYALERARSLFRLGAVRREFGQVARPDPHSATLLLRDLSIRLVDLYGPHRKRAEALLARPTDNPNPDDPYNNKYGPSEETPVCGTHVCIHYITSTSDAVSTTDTSPPSGIPDYVEQALDVFENTVWATEVTTMTYRAPKSDASSTNNGASPADPTGAKFDVYLLNLGDDGLYGYCTSDDPNLENLSYAFNDFSAYCVLDNDYTEGVFSAQPPLANFQVTAAHEFFHAVQAAYDWFEDQWLLEATAVWMEDELYDEINDNLQYLPDSPLRLPTVPLDKGATVFDPCCHIYGDWIFFRFLSEWFGPSEGVEDQTVVKAIWTRADGSAVGVDDYSILAIRNVASARGTTFRRLFAAFGWINRVSRSWYDEGLANHYRQAPLAERAMTLRQSAPSRSRAPRLNHQTNRYYEFKRGSGVSRTAKLKFVLDLPSRRTGPEASALVFRKSGRIVIYRFSLNSRGNGKFRVPFGSGVAKVDLVLTNASTRYSCWQDPPTRYACYGRPLDDRRTYKLTARLA
jgi:hypothetical protein